MTGLLAFLLDSQRHDYIRPLDSFIHISRNFQILKPGFFAQGRARLPFIGQQGVRT
jgi:hypothetical protein